MHFNISQTTCVTLKPLKQSLYESLHQRQVDLISLESYWKNKWKSFSGSSNRWSKKRQLYRFLYTTFRLFYYSFMQLNCSKIESEQPNNKVDYYTYYIGVDLCGVYNFGKKCVDLIKELKEDSKLDNKEKIFISQFVETRNKIIEHNFNPKNFNYKIDPKFWENSSTNSFLNITFHGNDENEFECRVDYYQDYFELENIFTKIIKSWA